jgi:hypothetical protein
MKPISLAMLLLIVAHSGLAREIVDHADTAHEPIDVTAKTLDEHLEIIVYHPSDDPTHYINHVTVMCGSRIILDKDFDAQTDSHSLDIQIPHPSKSPRKRIKKHAHITVYATCNQGEKFNREVVAH